MKTDKAWRKYLANHAEPETALVDTLPTFATDHVLIIPAYDESPAFFDRLRPLLRQNSVLLIVVINQPDSLPGATHCNCRLYEQLIENMLDPITTGNLTLAEIKDSRSWLLVVDRFQNGALIATGQGVGLARKIGADLAIALMDRDSINQSMLYCTDCDTSLPDDYFQIGVKNCAAFIYPFYHEDDGSPVATATALYEFSIQYYRAGLCHAGSPYAFHTIGSCMAIDAPAYCRAHGFPKRAGGEDFYLLNKLAKLGRVQSLTSPQILIKPRLSERIPFGTGPAVSRIIENMKKGEDFTVYHPAVFSELRRLLKNANSSTHLPSIQMILKDLSLEAVRVLHDMRIEEAIEKILNNLSDKTDNQMFNKHFSFWFDAFRTLKFIHGLRDSKYANVTLSSLRTNLLNQYNATWVENVPGYRPARDSEI